MYLHIYIYIERERERERGRRTLRAFYATVLWGLALPLLTVCAAYGPRVKNNNTR